MSHCNLCLKKHTIKHCPVFAKKSVENRRNYVMEFNYCLNCLAHNHPRALCLSSNRCAICGAKHHTMVHRERFHDMMFSSSYQDKIKIARTKATLNKISLNYLDQQCLPLRPRYWDRTIPPLIGVNLIHKGNPMFITFLLNLKEEYSFLLRSVANIFPDFTPSYRKGNVEYEEFQANPTYESCSRAVTNPLAYWRLELKNTTLVVPPPLSDPKLIKHFRNILPQAHPNFAICRKIDGVIGRKTWTAIKTDNIIQLNIKLPKAEHTIFGWVISGIWTGCSCH